MKKIKKLLFKKEIITDLKEEEMNRIKGGITQNIQDTCFNATCGPHCQGTTQTSDGGTSTCVCPSMTSYCPGSPTYDTGGSGTVVTTGGATCGAYC